MCSPATLSLKPIAISRTYLSQRRKLSAQLCQPIAAGLPRPRRLGQWDGFPARTAARWGEAGPQASQGKAEFTALAGRRPGHLLDSLQVSGTSHFPRGVGRGYLYLKGMQLGALSSDSLVYQMGYLMGKEHRALKIQVNFAPDIDINNNPSNPAINTRSFGEDKEKVSRYGMALMQGMKDAGVAGSAKHFPGHGDTDVDSHLALPMLPFSYERLDSLEMYPFKHLIAGGVDMVMVAHLNIPALDPSGTPSSISR